MESGRPSQTSGVPEVVRLLEAKDRDVNRNIHRTGTGPGANTAAELHLGALNKCSYSWMDLNLKPAEDSERMMREYCGSRIHTERSLGSRRSVDEFIKEQLHTDGSPQDTITKDGTSIFMQSRRNSADNARFKRMTSEDIRSQLYPDESLESGAYSTHERSRLRVGTAPDVRFNPDLNGNIELKRMTDEDRRSQLYGRENTRENTRLRHSLDSYPGSGSEIGDNHQRARSTITNEYIRSQLAADEPLRLTKNCTGSGILPRDSLASLETPELKSPRDVDDHPELNRMTSEYIKSQLHLGDKLGPDPTAQYGHLNMTRADIDPKLDLDPKISRHPGKPDLDPRTSRGDLPPQVDPERDLHSADLEPKLDIDPRFCRRAVGVAGFRVRGPNWPYYNSRLVSPTEQGNEEAEIYNVRGAKLLFVDGYKYSRKRVNKFGSVSWRCRVLGCHATITTTQEGEVLRLGRSGHTHLPNEKPPSGYEPENKTRKNSQTEEHRLGNNNNRQDLEESAWNNTSVAMKTEPDKKQPHPENKESESEACQEQGDEQHSSEITEAQLEEFFLDPSIGTGSL